MKMATIQFFQSIFGKWRQQWVLETCGGDIFLQAAVAGHQRDSNDNMGIKNAKQPKRRQEMQYHK